MENLPNPCFLLVGLNDFLKKQSEQLNNQDSRIKVLAETIRNLQAEVWEIKDKQDWERRVEEENLCLKQLAIFDGESGEVCSVEDFQSQ